MSEANHITSAEVMRTLPPVLNGLCQPYHASGRDKNEGGADRQNDLPQRGVASACHNAVHLSAEIVIEVNGEATLTLIGQPFPFNEIEDFILIF
ncbi:hypothetical protein [Butyricicoccus sp. Marseille-Q5471]|uniref:hypothetical protein n=1 Tax=Butyricicoccus sp. Marseille-Q5471 TaxID=3039493 RepID=UPI0024BC8F6A|nr:hypothetical protein [Butyricicoccus sp. Marseille-Q5471]